MLSQDKVVRKLSFIRSLYISISKDSEKVRGRTRILLCAREKRECEGRGEKRYYAREWQRQKSRDIEMNSSFVIQENYRYIKPFFFYSFFKLSRRDYRLSYISNNGFIFLNK